jgi:hypothetical protein
MLARLVMIALLGTACDKVSHDNLDKWMRTEKGPAKLKKALSDEGIDADLSAHAAANMIKKAMDPDVRSAFDQMTPPRRVAVLGKLGPRLWEIARVENELQMPGPIQVAAKDALVSLRKYGDDPAKQQIDGYLVDWYCVASYEGRAHMGATQGATAIRLIGAPAAKKLIGVVNGVIAAPGQDKAKNRIGDELMLALAASGSPDAVKYVLDIAKMNRGDTTLADRAMTALYRGFINSEGLFDPADPAGLAPNLDQLVAIAKDESTPDGAADDAVALIRAVGPPQCLAPLVGMIAQPHSNARFKYLTAQQALKCGGVKAIGDVVHALPDVPYSQRELAGAIAGEIADLSPRPTVLAAVRALLGDKKTLVRWVAIETLAAMKSVEDRAAIAAVSSGEKLLGYWGERNDDHKPEPTLGQRAAAIADQLGKAPK